jgi:hypothetical protein
VYAAVPNPKIVLTSAKVFLTKIPDPEATKKSLAAVAREWRMRASKQARMAFSLTARASTPGESTVVARSPTPPANIQIYSDVIAVHSAGIQIAPIMAPGGIEEGGIGEV